MLKTKRLLITILLFGFIWGCLEVVLKDSLMLLNVERTSYILTATGILILAIARIICNKPGSSLLIGMVAALFKVLSLDFFACQMFAIVIEAGSFDIIYSYLDKKVADRNPVRGFIGSISAYLGFVAFALSITYIVRYSYWVTGGWEKIKDYIFVSGSYAALASFPAVLIGAWIGRIVQPKLLSLQESRPVIYYSGAISLVVLCWLVGILLSV
jgi:hypothetical protein